MQGQQAGQRPLVAGIVVQGHLHSWQEGAAPASSSRTLLVRQSRKLIQAPPAGWQGASSDMRATPACLPNGTDKPPSRRQPNQSPPHSERSPGESPGKQCRWWPERPSRPAHPPAHRAAPAARQASRQGGLVVGLGCATSNTLSKATKRPLRPVLPRMPVACSDAWHSQLVQTWGLAAVDQ